MKILFQLQYSVILHIHCYHIWWKSTPTEGLLRKSNVIECTFGRRLKARFFALRSEADIDLSDLPAAIRACFALHNFCEVNKESVSNDRIRAAMENDQDLQRTNHATHTYSKEWSGRKTCQTGVYEVYTLIHNVWLFKYNMWLKYNMWPNCEKLKGIKVNFKLWSFSIKSFVAIAHRVTELFVFDFAKYSAKQHTVYYNIQ